MSSAPAASEADPPEFESLKREFAEVLAWPPPGLPPDCGPEFELHIETSKATMPRSRPMRCLSEGEMEECSRQVQWLLENGWIRP